MQLASRKLIDRSFTGLSVFSIVLVAGALVIILTPIVGRGMGAVFFRGTVEHRQVQLDLFGHGRGEDIAAEVAAAEEARRQVYVLIAEFEQELADSIRARRQYAEAMEEVKAGLRELLGPFPGETPVLYRERYGQTRWDRAQIKLQRVLYAETYDYSDPTQMGQKVLTPRVEEFAGTSLEPLFTILPARLEEMLRPRPTFYWRFFTNTATADYSFGGIWPDILGTFYLTFWTILFAVPMGIISAIYLVEYAREGNRIVVLVRTCINTLAGVPSIVFGLFGLAFFINTLRVSEGRSVLAGSLTLALLILPLVIRSAEEAIRAVPHTYKEASLSLGAGQWRTIVRVILPAALPGVLTGVVISMGRAAGETAPIIFTAAVSVARPMGLWSGLSEPTHALPWSVYTLCTEHKTVDEIRHVQYGMVFTLVLMVLLLNSVAILLRARISRKLRG
ncbi:MAG: phosphate ABC transporter permease PstA [Phycisphaerales bacterium]|nr:phosphate ABC transporter permease PstA [Phycisphaerales bacterium]